MSLSEMISGDLWPFSKCIYFFTWRTWWRDYAPVFLCIITGFSRSTLRARGVDWECMSQGWGAMHIILLLAEGSCLSCSCRILASSVPCWAGQHEGIPKSAHWSLGRYGLRDLSEWIHWERMSTPVMSGISASPSSISILFFFLHATHVYFCMPFPVTLLNETLLTEIS